MSILSGMGILGIQPSHGAILVDLPPNNISFLPGFMLAKMPYHKSSVMNDVALSTAPRYTPGPRFGGNGWNIFWLG